MQPLLATGVLPSLLTKSAGSDSRPALDPPLNASAQQSSTQQAHSHIGLDAGREFAGVNAETATALNRTVLQSLAIALAAKLGIARRANETMEMFFARLLAVLEKQLPDDKKLIEVRGLLKMLKLDLPDFIAALKAPDSAAAARLSAMVEAPQVTPQKTALNVANNTYLAGGAAPQKSSDALALGPQVRSTIKGQNIFAETAQPDRGAVPADPRLLQEHLQAIFEPGTEVLAGSNSSAHTRLLAQATEAMDDLLDHFEQTDNARRSLGGEKMPSGEAMEAPSSAERLLVARTTGDAAPEEKSPQRNNTRDASDRLADTVVKLPAEASSALSGADLPMETMLTFKGISVDPSTDLSPATPSVTPSNAGEEKLSAATVITDRSDPQTESSENEDPVRLAMRARNVGIDHIAFGSALSLSKEDETSITRHIASRISAQTAPAGAPLAEQPEQPQVFGIPLGHVSVTPARERFQTQSLREDEQEPHEDSHEQNEAGERGARNEDGRPDDEHPASSAVEEETQKITRDSSDADRAYALYQRMRGF